MFEEGLALVVYQIPTDLDIHLFESAVSGTLYTVIRKYNELETQMNNIPNSDLTPNEVIEVVCNMMSISPIEMMRKSRKPKILVPRQIVQYMLMKFVPGTSLARVGAITGNKDHATVIHSINTVKNVWWTDRQYGYGVLVNKINDTLMSMRRDRKELYASQQ